MGVARHDNQDTAEGDVSQQTAIRISHSLPDLQSDPITHEYVQEQKDNKKVLHSHTHKSQFSQKEIRIPLKMSRIKHDQTYR